ncbi:oxygen-insensitive NAD(P)H nitroreductase [Acerihabitans sp. TG2]|uniref:oxygen-insensitive NAD(P)H nitroreductase n=1 Tax=Acerihabitans sp. TG2 TaxID=3096008 RepID=UPI002B231D6B|nr:oxygen-insensitive NAD(P)H nitroreductase [Acerihabitans sp. TG2]MEA9390104.1 oxygen-insensitive NAD(P)H nitroreductase [Acerihabitans sp. TG2]
MNLDLALRTRYASKVYDETKKLTAEQEQQLLDLLRYSPSSVNSQPWHFFTLVSDAAKEKILPAVSEANRSKIIKSALVVVFTTRTQISEAHLNALLSQEQSDGRFATDEQQQNQDKGRRHYVGLNSHTPEQQRNWMARQAYISLGFLLLGAASMGLDATPIEGFFVDKMNAALNLDAKQLTSVVVATVGYHEDTDFNATLPKSRFPQEQVITRL